MRAKARAAEPQAPVRVVVITMDTHLSSATAHAAQMLSQDAPGVELRMHAAAEYTADPEALTSALADIAAADILIVTMLFLEEHFLPVLGALQARRAQCDAMLCAMSAAEVVKLTRLGRFDMSKPATGPMAFLKRLRGKQPEAGDSGRSARGGSGEQQMRMLRRLPKILRFIPGTAQDVRVYFLGLQYWLGGSQDNMVSMARMLINRYAAGPREHLKGQLPPKDPIDYPELGVYHPDLKGRLSSQAKLLKLRADRPRVGLLLLRSYLLAGNTAHYDGVIRSLEAQGLAVVPAFAVGLDARPAIESFFIENGRPTIDAMVSLTGFSLVGGPAYNDAQAAEEMLARLDVPYVAAHPVEFQTLSDWGASERGLMPVESTIMVAIPELDGATAPMVYGGRPGVAGAVCKGCQRGCTFTEVRSAQDMVSCPDRAEQLALRVKKMVELRRAASHEKRLAVVLFNFPPNGGSVGTAAHLAVFESLHALLVSLQSQGYSVELPADANALRSKLLGGNSSRYGTDANVLTSLSVADYIRMEPHLAEIESCWGRAPGRQLTDGRQLFVLGERFGSVEVLLQPGFGVEGDPMRLLFDRGLAPTHGFAAFYHYIKSVFQAHAVLHFGTHGALEFMPGKQAGGSGSCWPDRLIGHLPNFYLYAANNPSEGTIAKRRSNATLLSYLTPSITEAGLYRGFADLQQSLDRWRSQPPLGAEPLVSGSEAETLASVIFEQARALELQCPEPSCVSRYSGEQLDRVFYDLSASLSAISHTLIPTGLHVLGKVMSLQERCDVLRAMAQAFAVDHADPVPPAQLDRLITAIQLAPTRAASVDAGGVICGAHQACQELIEMLARVEHELRANPEIDAISRALEGGFVRPSPGGDLLRSPDVLPTGRNIHGFDPFRMPSRSAWRDGSLQAERLIARFHEDGHGTPESIAMVLWGTDNLKTEGAPIAQAMALIGAKPRFDGFGRLAGASLIPLEELGRSRIDVVITLSGIFRDLLPLQIRMLAEATFLAASAVDEPLECNPIRRHALLHMADTGDDLETAALRVFGNADGAYGANVNHLVEQGCWQNEDELADCYAKRKGFAYGRNGRPVRQPALLQSTLRHVSLAYQNLESLEVGVTTVDTYFDTLGGVSRLIRQAKGGRDTPVYIGDQTSGQGVVRSLSEQVALETRTRMLNPKWYEAMLEHGYEGVRQIEAHLTNTMGWSATTGQVQPWVYQQLTQTYIQDEAMRDRLAALNPAASAKLAGRLLEASERRYWTPDEETRQKLLKAGEFFEDRLEGIAQGAGS
jgi:magnesium chelatase subunit H